MFSTNTSFMPLQKTRTPSHLMASQGLQESQISGAGASAQGKLPWFAVVIPEILAPILSSLTNSNRKSLRPTYKVFQVTPLCLSRVFLPTKPRDIEMFHALADHPKFPRQVTEIIWDEARFIPIPSPLEDEWYAMIEHGI
jgi:hypothetical protein